MKKVTRIGDGLAFANGFWRTSFDSGAVHAGNVFVEPMVVLTERGQETSFRAHDLRVVIDDGLLVRVVAVSTSPEGHKLRVTYDPVV